MPDWQNAKPKYRPNVRVATLKVDSNLRVVPTSWAVAEIWPVIALCTIAPEWC